MGPPKRERYNAKARGSVAGAPAKKRRRVEQVDSNVELIQPTQEDEKKLKLMEEMKATTETVISSKKRKRMEKYIDKKLKQESSKAILQDLAALRKSQGDLDLVSPSILGTGKLLSRTEEQERKEHVQVGRLMRRFPGVRPALEMDVDASDSEGEVQNMLAMLSPNPSSPVKSEPLFPVMPVQLTEPAQPLPVVLGSALRRDEDGTVAAPLIMKKKKSKRRGKGWNIDPQPGANDEDTESDTDGESDDESSVHAPPEVDEEEEWKGISTSDEDGTSSSKSGDEDGSGSDSNSNSEESDGESDSDSDQPEVEEKPKRSFKAWAQQQVLIAKGATPLESNPLADDQLQNEANTTSNSAKVKAEPASHTLPSSLKGPLGSSLHLPKTSFAQRMLSALSPSSSLPTANPPPSLPPLLRKPEIQATRLLLPILAEEQTILETILLHPIVIIQGETGSGKTSQVVQMLFEAGWGRGEYDDSYAGDGKGKKKDKREGKREDVVGYGGIIGITQPRRVAAVSMANRVAEEMMPPPSSASNSTSTSVVSTSSAWQASLVSYQIRHTSTTSSSTRIKFMTEGILLRELQSDLLLRRYSVIILDEVHERGLGTDVLIGALSRVCRLREEMSARGEELEGKKVGVLRVVLMSATLPSSPSPSTEGSSSSTAPAQTNWLTSPTLFPPPSPPLLSIPARQHPISIHFARRTRPNYVDEAVKKTVKIHKKLPPGGVLVFLTGREEVEGVCRRLRGVGAKKRENRLGKKAREEQEQKVNPRLVDVEVEDIELGGEARGDSSESRSGRRRGWDEEDNVMGELDPDALESDDEDGEKDGEEAEDRELKALLEEDLEAPMHILPLYSLLSPERQMKVFDPPPSGARLVVVATNVAETSITIPGIRYVVDCGRAKERHYDPTTSITSFPISFISQSSASQRAGRAGRTGPGHVYRLYSSSVFANFFPPQSTPEILRMPLESVVLSMKNMGIENVVNFPFPTPPDQGEIKKAERVLKDLGALGAAAGAGVGTIAKKSKGEEGLITDLGKAMALFPLTPRWAKMLVLGRQHGCMGYAIAMVAACSVGEPFLGEDEIFGARLDKVEEDGEDGEGTENEPEEKRAMRKKYFASRETHSSLGDHTSDMFKLLSVVGAYEYAGGGRRFCEDNFVRAKTMDEIHKLRKQIHDIVAQNFPEDSVEFKADLGPPSTQQLKALRQLVASGLIDQVAVRKDLVDRSARTGAQYRNCRGVAYRAIGVAEDVFIHPSSVVFGRSPPPWVVYQDVVQTSRAYLKRLTVINPLWLPKLAPSLCTFTKEKLPAGVKAKKGNDLVAPHYGPEAWTLPLMPAPSVPS